MNAKSLNSAVTDLHQNERGAVLIWFTLFIAVLMGLIGIALEGGALLNLNSQMQSMADAAALAGAKKLDGSTGAMDRATDAAAAVAGASSNNPNWSNIPRITGNSLITTSFYSSLSPDVAATGDRDAKYIKVTTESRGLAVQFMRAVGTVNDGYTRASAVAGVSFITCRPLQSFFCNPFELGDSFHTPPIPAESNPGSASNFATYAKVGQMFKLINGAGAPGNWGVLLPSSHHGSKGSDEIDFWSAAAQDTCTVGSAGDLELITGNIAKKGIDGINVRFDSPLAAGDKAISGPVTIDGTTASGNNYSCVHYWNGSTTTTGANKDNRVTPAGFDPDHYNTTCNGSANGNSVSCPFPRDTTFEQTYSLNASWASGYMWGQGVDNNDLQFYWKNHHSGSMPSIPTGVAPRYYLYRVEAGEIAGVSAPDWLTDGVEQHSPGTKGTGSNPDACLKSTKGTASRRLIDVAIVDCDYWHINGTSNPLPPTTLNAQFFVTEPAYLTGNGANILNVMGELVSVSQANSGNGAVHEVVFLVR